MKANASVSDHKIMGYGAPRHSTGPRAKRTRTANQRIPTWAYLLFILLAAFVTYRIFQNRAAEAKATEPPPRPVTVAKVVAKDVPLYLDEIGTCAAYETVQVQAQVSGKIIGRHFQDGSDVKKGDLLFTIDPRPYQAALDQAKAQAALDQVTLKATRGAARQEGHSAAGVRHCSGECTEVSGCSGSCPGEPRLLLHQIAD